MHRKMAIALSSLAFAAPALAQRPPGTGSSPNVHLMAHIPLDGIAFSTTDIEIEQELSRPYAYVPKRYNPSGIVIISLKDPKAARIIYDWRIENPELHQGAGALAPTYLKSHGRYFFVNGFQFAQGGPDGDLGAVVWDVTGLPDTSKVRVVARIRHPDVPGGFHETFSYKHSNGMALLLATTQSPYAHVYDIDKVVANGANGANGLVAKIPVPEGTQPSPVVPSLTGYHDFYVGYDPASHQDRFYGAGAQGYYVYDITDLSAPRLLMSIAGVPGVPFGHTFTPTPDGRYAVTETEHQYQPLRFFDLKPGLDGTVKSISRPIGAWSANWKHAPHNHEVRWPYVFVASFEDGLQILNMMDPTNPYTVGYYDTYDGPDGRRCIGALGCVFDGGWGIDVRNADGLIVLSDFTTGFWAFRMDGFDGWNGHQWGMPNISSAQDWDNGPDGAPKPAKVS